MPVIYPFTLPGPVAYAFTPRERRAVSQGDGPQRLRARARDSIVDAPSVRWFLTPEQLIVWNAWYEEDLLHGQRWFAVPLPGAAGAVVRVARFTSAVSRIHRGAGCFELSADLEVRGRSALPEVAAGGGAAIGWLAPIGSSGGTAAHANAGTGYFSHVNPALRTPPTVYAGVVGYAGQTVVWSSTWTPVTSDASPTVTGLGGGLVSVNWGSVFSTRNGMLVLTATIDGVPIAAGQRLVFTNDPALEPGVSFYDPIAWGPEP